MNCFKNSPSFRAHVYPKFGAIVVMMLVLTSATVRAGGGGPGDGTSDPQATDRKETQAPLFWREFLLGGASGIVEVSVNQPIVYWKNSVQQRKKIKWRHPSVWYRGYSVNAGSMAPITAIQMGANSVLASMLKEEGEEEISDNKRIFVSGLAGMISALVSSPAELAMIQQQNNGKGLHATVAEIFKSGRSTIFRGLIPTAIRDGMFTAGYITVAPLVQREIQEVLRNQFDGELDEKFDTEFAASIAAGAITGAGVAISTQPWDMIKTTMQSKQGDATIRETIRSLYQEGGVVHFWRGGIGRGTRIVLAITLMNEFQRQVRSHLD